MIAIIDYGMGNLRSVQKAFERFEPDTRIVTTAADILVADKLVLPGVGAFGDCNRNLRARGLDAPLLERAEKGVPLLGICVGMQLLFTEGEEKGRHAGLNLIPGRVVRFTGELKVPQIGWNQVAIQPSGKALFQGIPDNADFYFVHSYYPAPKDPSHTAGLTDYGIPYASAVARGTVFGVQFHPEKSQKAGLCLIDNFCKFQARNRIFPS
ncbi:MAG: imidazole glycerol phosphate synthase subunit HisH [Fibrobacterota bacterium]